MAKSEETQCAMDVVVVRVFDWQKQEFGCTLESMTALTSLALDNLFLNFSMSSACVLLSDALNTQVALTELNA